MTDCTIRGYDIGLEILATLSRVPAPVRLLREDFGLLDKAKARLTLTSIQDRFGVKLEQSDTYTPTGRFKSVRIAEKSLEKACDLSLSYWNAVYPA